MKNTIVVLADDSTYGKAALAHAQKLAQIFDATVNTIFITEKADLRAVFSATEAENTLCFVMSVASSKKLAFFNVKNARKWIRKSRIPVLVVGDRTPKENDYQQIILPLDINCQDKELALWASYFPAYFQKNCPNIPKENLLIHIIFNQYKDELLNQKVLNNIAFVTKMFDNLEAPYRLHPFTKIDNIHTFGLKFAEKTGNSIMLFLMTEHYSFIDLIFGPVENKILGNKERIPVLCLNPREDIFVLCQ
ncbi:MAG: hypothetical protein FWC34_06740 [Bacteroidetes bacterium]|nr:hypothetical protein [Bacteroidota bacterium]MCL2303614.1 hypothetical protein [Lentimicrobiaceae bacterium]